MNGGWQYVAGFFDGEGSVRVPLNGSRQLPKLVFYQSERMVLERIQEFLAARGIEARLFLVPKRKKTNLHVISQKQQLQLVISRWKYVERAAIELLPYLIVKKPIVQDILRFRKIYPALTGTQYADAARQTRWKCVGHSSCPKYEYKHEWYENNKRKPA